MNVNQQLETEILRIMSVSQPVGVALAVYHDLQWSSRHGRIANLFGRALERRQQFWTAFDYHYSTRCRLQITESTLPVNVLPSMTSSFCKLSKEGNAAGRLQLLSVCYCLLRQRCCGC